jgi:adenylosuccinate synthase
MNLVVIGAQWGDEGKGKIVDYLSADAEIIVRFAGGANAGHTIVTENITYKLHLVPSGIISPDKTVILGTGMVIDLESLFKELKTIEDQGINWKNRVLISDRAHIVLPEYKEEDKAEEAKRKRPIGTTGRGIGVAYAYKSARDGIRIADLYDSTFYPELDKNTRAYLDPYKEKIKDMVIDIADFMHKNKTKNRLFEGAQGILLDLDIGTYPFVSSGMSAASGASAGSGVGPRALDKILGVFKAYSTRVGNGPFPSEFKKDRDGNMEEVIREIGREYGVTTGRPRRCGYLDLVALKYACITNSIDSLVLTHLDVYDGFDEIKTCTAYEYNGAELSVFPSSLEILNKAQPVLKTFKGWKQSLGSIKSFDELPEEAKAYLKFIEDYTETPVDIISVGYERKQTILRKNPWTKY